MSSQGLKELSMCVAMQTYQKFTPTTALYPGAGTGNKEEIIYLCLGMMGEAQEWHESDYSSHEAGDIFWYLSQLHNVFGWKLTQTFIEVSPNTDPQFFCSQPNLPEFLKKFMRDDKDPTKAIKSYCKWIIQRMKNRYHYSVNNPPLSETIKTILLDNQNKLLDRKDRNVLHGDGDTR